jgi:HPt (histidine-containing phosphotransfer) domain-containing protein
LFNAFTVDLAALSTQQLSQVKKQLDDELEHLTNSFQQLRAAQAKFRDCLRSIATGVSNKVQGTSSRTYTTQEAGEEGSWWRGENEWEMEMG